MSTLWPYFAQLESLTLKEVQIIGLKEPTEIGFTCTWPRMRSLTLCVSGLSGRQQLKLIRSCPELRTLRWYDSALARGTVGTMAHGLSRCMRAGSWRKLESLDADLGVKAGDDLVAEMLLTMEQVRSLRLSKSRFGPLSFKVFKTHFSVLQSLDINLCGGIDSKMVQEILCSSPVLQSLMLHDMLARDAIEPGKEWKCTSLKTLRLNFKFRKDEMHLQPLIFERLSKLNSMEHLDLGSWAYSSGESGLRLRLEDGLAKLGSWTRLRTLDYSGTWQSIGFEELAWMQQHWTNVHSIIGKTADI
ncbi:hypothetical protein BGZ72_004441 [Mortierella alpina]|nr:hypothetical protein BGZ72_004441 [Mortierella alpina]